MMEGHSLKCSVCLELYNDPRVLPCLHTFCLKCIKGFSNKDSSLTCPECRAKHEPLPVSGTNYPVNVSILPELEEAKSGDKGSRICGFCTAGDVAVGFCEDCGEYLCQYCRDFHKKGKAFLSHNISAIDDSNSTLDSVVSFSKQPANVSCVRHPKYELEIYCRDCSCLVCYKCMFEPSHKGHDYGSINDVSQEIEQEMKSLSEAASSKEIQFEACVAFIEKIERAVILEQDKVRQKVKSIFDNLMTLLEEVFTEDNKTIWAVKNDFQMALPQIKSSHSLSAHAQRQIGQNIQCRSLVNQLLQCLMKIKNINIPGAMEDVFHARSSSTSFQKELFELLNFDDLLRHLLASRDENEYDTVVEDKCFWDVSSDEESEPDWDEIEKLIVHETLPRDEEEEEKASFYSADEDDKYPTIVIPEVYTNEDDVEYNAMESLAINDDDWRPPDPALLKDDVEDENEKDLEEGPVRARYEPILIADSCTVPFTRDRVRAIAVIEQPFAKLTQWSVQCVSHEDQGVLAIPFGSNKFGIEFYPSDNKEYTFHLSPVGTNCIVEFIVDFKRRFNFDYDSSDEW
ncbi:PREDICTED: E3 ubiquitin-protein ligase TRIM56-like [Amphimedon queenslandica]|uniref:Uncharacterized protein n=1 Tax=Amphimedon queenslandica TaxID=400682 RepID=A0A1X7U7T4_AMPQE|nr:PREDICTED: E3 ubiquitin-protein ligase TRIM56-like [Amphimedon queenslandica]|eukprot:XP_011405840.1 PREDICTED: E3 ubiquitin-protein ligase TRIM56-like [Amphimedon queenslandica]